MTFFTEIEQKILKLVWNHQRPHIAKAIPRKKEKKKKLAASHALVSNYTTKLYSSKQHDIGRKKRHRDQCTRIKNSEINVDIIYNKEAKDIQQRKQRLSNKWYWENWTATCKRMKPDHYLIPYTKINSKWIEELNTNPETTKLPEENIDGTSFDIDVSNIFSDLFHQEGKQKQK